MQTLGGNVPTIEDLFDAYREACRAGTPPAPGFADYVYARLTAELEMLQARLDGALTAADVIREQRDDATHQLWVMGLEYGEE